MIKGKRLCEQKLYRQKGPIYIILAQPGKERYEAQKQGNCHPKFTLVFASGNWHNRSHAVVHATSVRKNIQN